MVTSTKLVSGLAFEITTSDFTAKSDVSQSIGGNHSAPTPHDYIEIALAACTSITVQMYAKRKEIPLDYTDVKVNITSEGPAGNTISREVNFVGANLTAEHKQTLLTIAEKCPIHKFLTAGAKITTTMV